MLIVIIFRIPMLLIHAALFGAEHICTSGITCAHTPENIALPPLAQPSLSSLRHSSHPTHALTTEAQKGESKRRENELPLFMWLQLKQFLSQLSHACKHPGSLHRHFNFSWPPLSIPLKITPLLRESWEKSESTSGLREFSEDTVLKQKDDL